MLTRAPSFSTPCGYFYLSDRYSCSSSSTLALDSLASVGWISRIAAAVRIAGPGNDTVAERDLVTVIHTASVSVTSFKVFVAAV